MQRDPIITWRNLTRSEAVENLVRKRIEAVERFCPEAVGLRVTLDAPQKPRHTAFGIAVSLALHPAETATQGPSQARSLGGPGLAAAGGTDAQLSDCSAPATWRFTAMKLSGVTETESIPALTSSLAKAGSLLGA